MLTPTESKTLAFLQKYLRETGGVAPSYTEIQRALGLRGRGGVGVILDGLQAKGRITHLPRRARAISVLPARKPFVTYKNAQYFVWDEETQTLKPR